MNYSKNHKSSVELTLICALTAGIVACSDSPSGGNGNSIAVEVSGKTVGDTLVFDMMDSTYDFKIEANGKWRIEDETDFIQSISQDSGEGNATIQVRLTTNDWDDRYVGDLHIVFPEDTSLNKTITVVQKYSGDYDDNAVTELTQSNKVYAIGYGYNAITGGYPDYEAIKCEIFDVKKLNEDGGVSIGPTKASLKTTSITGSTISDISFQLSSKVNVEGGIAGFSGEIGAAFDMNTSNKSNYEYALTYLDLAVKTAGFDLPLELLKSEEYMKKFAYNSINGLNTSYPSTNEGFKKLVRDFGTHVVWGSRLGGRIRQSMTADVSKITSKYDISAFAKAAYKGVVDASAEVSTEMKSSLEQNLSNVNIDIDVLGGDDGLALKLSDSKILNNEDVNKWKQSVSKNTGAATLIGFSDGGLIPLYELIDESLGEKAKERKQKLKDYLNGKQVASDFEYGYDCGTVTEIDVPKIEDLDTNTLIKDIYLGGQLVAKAMLEFVPLLNLKEKVMVIYPVINNKVRFNLGFYIGDKDHKPARVSWDGTDAAIVEYENMNFGAAKKLYIRGASVTSVAPEGTEHHAGTVEDAYLASKIYVPKVFPPNSENDLRDGKVQNHNYPLVKVFNRIWLRDNYASTIDKTGKEYQYVAVGEGTFNVFHGLDNKPILIYKVKEKDKFVPSGWSIPTKEAFLEIENVFKNNKLTNLGAAMTRKSECDSKDAKGNICGLVGLGLRKDKNGITSYYAINNGQIGVEDGASTFNILGTSAYDALIFYQE